MEESSLLLTNTDTNIDTVVTKSLGCFYHTQVRRYEYDLLLNSDINTDHHHQWFYFKV